MQKDAVATTPAVIVSGLGFMGVSLNEWVLIGTLCLIVFQGVLLLRKIYISFRRKSNKKKRKSSDEN